MTIKNENGEPKYKTVADALKALANSQAFIPQLLNEKKTVEEELKQLREQAAKQQSIEEVLAKLTANNEEKPVEKTPPASGLDANAVADLVRKELEAVNSKAQQQKNLAEVNNSLKQKFGDKAREVLAAKAVELGSTPEDLGELAKKSPAMVLALFGDKKSTSTPVTSSFNLPRQSVEPELERPTKSLLLGATSRDQKDYMSKVRERVYKRHNVEV
jgi:vacuolar-type H+-ATPase subunit I/STV1